MGEYVSVKLSREFLAKNFELSRPYTYFNHEPDLAVGDYVLTEVGDQLMFGKVIDIDPPPEACAKATKWIVQKIDMDKYNALKAMTSDPEATTKAELAAQARRRLVQYVCTGKTWDEGGSK